MNQALSPEARRDWLRLARTEGVGPVTFDQLIRRYAEPSRALEALPELARRGGRTRPPAIPTQSEAQAELDAGEALGAQLICACDPDFPQALAALDPPPPLLWARGDVSLLDRSVIAIVGARVASAAGQRFARGLAAELGQVGHVIASGMARGIDGAAHEGALEQGTIAVLGGGVDDIYPPEHRDLYQRLVAEGCVVAEHPPGRQAQARDFPRRNRIIAGLSRAVVVVEAELRSGSLITARLAAEQGREVLAVPGSPLDPRARGTNDLIRQGAAVCEGALDVLRVLESMGGVGEREREPWGPPPPDPADESLKDRVA
ncbi:MAG: DNA-processing protein DprA, partial [Phenylobacterium sp.]|nr:DNA-processing protein DprA [Phenylobacterium sp.]